MGWFDEQIKARKKSDDETFEDSFIKIAGSVMGRKLSAAIDDERERTTDAVKEILHYYHVPFREVPESKKDMEEVLEYLLRPSGIMTREVELTPGFGKNAAGAMLTTFKKDGRPVALVPSGAVGYRFVDPISGEYIPVTSANESLFSGMAYAFYKPFPMKELKVWHIFKYIWENAEKRDLIMFFIFSGIVSLIGLLNPWFNNILFSDVVKSKSMQVLLAMANFMIMTAISTMLFTTIKTLYQQKISAGLTLNVEAATMMRMLSLPASFFKDYSAGELARRSQYLNTLVDVLINVGFSALITSLFSLVYITEIFVFAPSLVTPAVTVTLITLVISILAALMQMRVSREQMKLQSKESGMGYALISGIQKIKLAGAEKRAFARWGRLYAEEAAYMYNPPLFIKVNQVVVSAVSLFGTIIIYYVAVKNGVSVSEYYAFNSAYGMMSTAFAALSAVAVAVAQIKPILDMAKPIMETVPEIAEEKQVVERLSGSIELNNVTFRYKEDMPAVLDDISLRIRAGQYVAIVGKTGCGKSTLMRIMLGFEQPQKGAVYYDGKDLKTIDLKSLRSRIGTVMQDGKLFSGDIYSNIVISAPELPLEAAWEAAERAGMADDIRMMPMGMYTLISEGQGGISGGQRQRLMIARAIAPKPKILMFDEATSALDNLTQKTVSESLDELKCTRVVIAHRLSTIKHCDRIIVLDQGRIIEDGTYDELMALNGYFTDLVSRQQLDENKDNAEGA